MNIKRSFFFVLSFICFLLFTAQTIRACECGDRPTVLTSFNRAENVFIGEIIKFGKEENGDDQGATFLVKKVYKGSLKEGNTKFFVQGSGDDCQFGFGEKMVGVKFLVYDSDKGWGRQREGITFCGRSTNVERAIADLLYLDNIDKLQGKTRIYGNIWFAYGRENPQDRKIRIVGKDKTYEVTTDKNGFYEIYDLPAGEYVLEPIIPKGWRIEENFIRLAIIPQSGENFPNPESPTQFPIVLEPQKDASYDFLYMADNAIRGRILDPLGKPLYGICVAAIKSDSASLERSESGCTNENGQFEITSLDRNSYILVINYDGKISPKQPIQRLFYPGVKNRSEATTIKILEGERIELNDFKVSEVLETITLSGTLTFSDGTPVRREFVEFIPDKKDENLIGDNWRKFDDYTDDDGRFLIKIFKGQTGKIRAKFGIPQKSIESCAEIKNALIESKSEYGIAVVTQWFEIKADQDLKDIKLSFPFPNCPKLY